MDVNPGDFNRSIVIEQKVSAGNVLGAGGQPQYQERIKVWANVKGNTKKDKFIGDAGIRAKVSAVFLVPYLEDVVSTDRIVYQNKNWRITGLAEVGYRELLEITAEVPDE